MNYVIKIENREVCLKKLFIVTIDEFCIALKLKMRNLFYSLTYKLDLAVRGYNFLMKIKKNLVKKKRVLKIKRKLVHHSHTYLKSSQIWCILVLFCCLKQNLSTMFSRIFHQKNAASKEWNLLRYNTISCRQHWSKKSTYIFFFFLRHTPIFKRWFRINFNL